MSIEYLTNHVNALQREIQREHSRPTTTYPVYDDIAGSPPVGIEGQKAISRADLNLWWFSNGTWHTCTQGFAQFILGIINTIDFGAPDLYLELDYFKVGTTGLGSSDYIDAEFGADASPFVINELRDFVVEVTGGNARITKTSNTGAFNLTPYLGKLWENDLGDALSPFQYREVTAWLDGVVFGTTTIPLSLPLISGVDAPDWYMQTKIRYSSPGGYFYANTTAESLIHAHTIFAAPSDLYNHYGHFTVGFATDIPGPGFDPFASGYVPTVTWHFKGFDDGVGDPNYPSAPLNDFTQTVTSLADTWYTVDIHIHIP